MNKKFFALFGAAALTVGLLAGCGGNNDNQTPSSSDEGGGDAGFTTIQEGKLIMSTNAEFPPYELVSDGAGVNGTGFEGIDVEIACALADRLGLELVIDDMDFDGALIAVQEGRSDMVLAGLTYDTGRDLVMDFTSSYAKGVQVVIVPEGSPIETIDDLANASMIGTQRGTTGFNYTTGDYGDDHVTAYDNGATAVQALLNGQIDCVVIDNAPAQEYVKANPGLKILDTAYADEDYCIAVDEGNTGLRDALDKELKEMIADGTIQEIIDRYIPAE